ncbi:ABC transporter permease [Corynebacterium sp. CCM 9185]|nr:ABC transporter permease [Corynebacterium marambiense]MCK7663230.1 ABC transporter permease [Corynebacterium marambiense]MCX7542845.1 ABC transporter permease [Corynebacterium marambiense]
MIPEQPDTRTGGEARFAPGTFSPDPQQAGAVHMLLAQALIEARLFLRHSEQQLLSLVIPLGSLIALSLVPLLDAENPVALVLPLTLAISAVSAGFTGQAIAVAFDRRYGALKRIGASGVPRWVIITGKVLGVLAVSAVQTVLLCVTALILGWRPDVAALPVAVLTLIVGVATFTALGLLMGGTLSSEIVLALANLVWFLLIGMASYVQIRAGSIGDWADWTVIIPSVALTQGLTGALSGGFPGVELLVLTVWATIGGIVTVKVFKFTA